MIYQLVVRYRNFFVMILHFILILLAYLGAFYVRFDLKVPVHYLLLMLKTMPALIGIKIVIFYYFGLFHMSIRFVSIFDLWRIIKANIVATVCFIIVMVFAPGSLPFPRSIFILDWVLCMSFVGGIRFISRLFRERSPFSIRPSGRKTLIVGAGEAGLMILKEYRNNPNANVDIVGFIDDDRIKKNLMIHGVKVLGSREHISEIVKKYHIEEIIIAIPSASGEVIRDIISYCQIPDVKIKIVPTLHKILSGDLEIKPREVRPEDLLGREVVHIDEKEIREYLKNKRILVTGAGGSIGSEICRQVVKYNPESIILYDHNENDVYFLEVEFKNKHPHVQLKIIVGDIKDVGLLKHVFSKYKPQVIFHAAAHKHVPLMEEVPSAAVKNNIIGSRNLIYAANHYNVERFVLISTDKAVNPTSIMGATKRIAEMILQAKSKRSKTKYMAVRFGNVIGSTGSAVPLFKRQIEEGGPVTVTHPEVKRYFMSVGEAVKLVLQAGALGKGGEIFVLDMGEQIKIVDLAKNLITLCGFVPDKDISIKFIGLRPGEKLFEELLLHHEKDKATRHDRIYIAQANDFDSNSLLQKVKKLEALANHMEDYKLIEAIQEITPLRSLNGA